MKKSRYQTVDQRRAAEHYEDYVKAAFASACVAARKLGWTWEFEHTDPNIYMWVNTGKHTLGCSDRLDFFKLVQEESK